LASASPAQTPLRKRGADRLKSVALGMKEGFIVTPGFREYQMTPPPAEAAVFAAASVGIGLI